MNGARTGSAVVVRADLLDLAALPSLVDEATRAFGRLDGLVNNASSFYSTPFGKIPSESGRTSSARTCARRSSSRRPPRRGCASRRAPS
jgi:NAD(P)-dependent dehydrogenase (short-subunit alcohol dehydrogenase family)